MKLVTVTQWVRVLRTPIPPDQRLAGKSVATSTWVAVRRLSRLDGAKMQAAYSAPKNRKSWSNRIPSALAEAKPTPSQRWKAAVGRTTRPCATETTGVPDRRMYRHGSLGNLGEPSVSWLNRIGGPCGRPPDPKPRRWPSRSRWPTSSPDGRGHEPEGSRQVSGRRPTRTAARDGLMAVLAEHSTVGWSRCGPGLDGGEPRPTGPTRGKAKPGMTFGRSERWKTP